MILAYIELAVAMCLVGINVALGKALVQTIPVYLLSDLRFIIAAIILFPILIMRGETKLLLTRRDWGSVFLQAFFGVFLFSVFMLYGVRYTTAISAGVITSTTPAFISLLALIFLRERLTVIKGISILLATAINAIGFILFTPFAIHDWLITRVAISLSTWILVIYYSLTASVISYVLWYAGMRKVSANTSGIFTVFMPISAALVGSLFLHERLAITEGFGLIVAVGAIFLGTWKRPVPQKAGLHKGRFGL